MGKLLEVGNNSGTGYSLDPSKPYTLIGRAKGNNIIMASPSISRFHATIVHDGEENYILSHAYNRTSFPYNPNPQEESKSVIESIFDVKEIRKLLSQKTGKSGAINPSHAEAKKFEEGPEVSQIPGYEPHSFHSREDMQSFLDMLENEEERDILISSGKRLIEGEILAFPLNDPIYLLMYLNSH